MQTQASIETNGISTHYQLHGPASAPVLAFSHSLCASLEMWQPQLESFSATHRILLYDTRGHGHSTPGQGPATIATLAQDLLSLLDTLSIPRIHFCGISMGGVIGQWLGIHAPERLHSLTLANTAMQIGTPDTWNPRIATAQREGLDTIIPGTLERWFTPAFRIIHPETVARIEHLMHQTNPNGYATCCAALRDADFRHTASQIRTPTLLIAGQHDPTTTTADLQALAAAIPGSQYVELDSAHLSSVEAAPAFSAALRTFLDSLT